MKFTLSALARSLADHLAPALPEVQFLQDPSQQGTKPPAMFLQCRRTELPSQTGGRCLRKLDMELVYLEDYNQVDMERRYLAAADALDEALETFPFRDAPEEVPIRLRTYRRSWDITGDVLRYQFQLQLRLSRQEDAVLMQSLQSVDMEVHS